MNTQDERLPPGTLLDGRFRVLRKLGAGGMAEVHLVRDEAEGTERALKVMAEGLSGDQLERRFRREFLACAGLKHPNVLRLHEMGRLDDGRLFYTMEFLPFADLRAVVRRAGALPERLVAEIGRQLFDALEAVHAAGLVHRDVKPSNLILTGRGRLVLMDFGLVRDESGTVMTRTGQVLGTPRYAAPEQLRGERSDGRADLFAAGALFHFLLTATEPFPGENVAQAAHAVMSRPARRLSELRSGLAPGWQILLDGLLEKERERRYPSATAAREDLLRLRAGAALVGAPVPVPPDLPPPPSDPSAPKKPDGPRRFAPSPVTEELARLSAPSIGTMQEDGREADPPLRRAGGPKTSLVPGGVFLLVAALIVVGIVSSGRRGGASKSYGVRELRIRPEVGAFALSWESDEAYPSRIVELDPPGGRVERLDGDGGRAHRIRVAGLEEGSRYAFRLLFPRGRSLPKSVVTLRFALGELAVDHGPEGRRLRIVADHAVGVELAVTGRGRRTDGIRGRRGDGGTWVVDCPADPTIDAMEIAFELEGGGRRRVALGPWLDGRCRSLLARLESFEVTPLAKGVLTAMSPRFGVVLKKMVGSMQQAEWRKQVESDEEERARLLAGAAKVRAITARRLEDMGVLPSYRAARTLAPLVVDTRLLPLERRLAFHEQMLRWEDMHLYFALREVPLSDPPFPVMGLWSMALGRPEGRWREKVLFAADGEDDELRLGLRVPFVKRRCQSTWETRFTLDEVEGFREACLLVSGESTTKHVLMGELNGLFPFRLYERPLLQGREGRPLRRGLPPEVLRRGENVLRLRVEPFFDHVVSSVVGIDGIRLLLR